MARDMELIYAEIARKAEMWKQSGLDRDKYQMPIKALSVSAIFISIAQMAEVGAAKQAAYQEHRRRYREENPMVPVVTPSGDTK